DGILALDNILQKVGNEFLQLGLSLMVDGYGEDVTDEILTDRKKTLTAQFTKRLDLIQTAIESIQTGEHPRLLEVRCKSLLPEKIIIQD
ncbi:MAG: flagellar motor component MotA, partial [bacterium]